MYNFCAKFRQILEICKRFSGNLVNLSGNVPRVGVVPRFSDLEVVALSLTAEAMGIDSENYLFHRLSSCKDEMPNLISRRQYNDRRKLTAGLSEEIRKRIAEEIDGGEDCFIIDSKPIEVCKPDRCFAVALQTCKYTIIVKMSVDNLNEKIVQYGSGFGIMPEL